MVRYTPSANYNGADEFTFQTTDGIEDSNIATVTITVNQVNDNPIANPDNKMGQEDTTFGGNLLANDLDIDGDSLVAVNATATSHGVLNLMADGTFSYTPEADYVGADSFLYTVSDGNGGFATGSVMITITQVNDAPIANDDSGYTTLSQPVLVKVLDNDSDIDSTNLNVGSVGTASHGTVTIKPDGKGVIYTPANGYSGNDQFTYTVTDGSLSDTATVTIKVYNIKFGHLQPPVGGGGDHEFEQGNTASVRLELKDASGNDIVDAIVILRLQELDSNNMPVGPVINATAAGGSNEGNVFDYSTSWYQYNLKTEDMTIGKWALYVYMIDTSTDPATEVLLEDQPIDGISTTIIIK
jgi:VCBS repeat-containing protein